jgi:hypothetical protein
MIVGAIEPGRSIYELAADQKRVCRVQLPEDGYLVKLGVYLDTLGDADAKQLARGIVYAADGSLIGQTAETTLPPTMNAGWAEFRFSEPEGVPCEAQQIDIGLIGGSSGGLIRMYGNADSVRGGKYATDSYTDGPSDPFGAATAVTSDLSIYATYTTGWTLPRETDFWYGRLPYRESQDKLGETGPLARTAVTAQATWHGTAFDGEWGAFVLVKTHGDLEDRIGERLKITRKYKGKKRIVYAYCHGEAVMEHDLSLTRQLFGKLGPLSADFLRVSVETLGS